MLKFVQTHPVASAVCAIALTLLANFISRGYAIRKKAHRMHGPPHSWIWGHLKVMAEIMKEVPLRAHPHVIPLRMSKKYNLGSYFYFDPWPFAEPIIYVFDPAMSQQLTVDLHSPKHQGLKLFMIHLAGPDDLVSSEGAHWKKWRSMLNPGFAISHLMTLVPGIVDDGVVFAEKLGERADKGDVFRLEEDATRLTVDIIGKVTLDIHLGTQRGENEMVTAFRDQVHLVPNEGMNDPFKMWYPYGIYRRWRNSRIMNRYIGQALDKRFSAHEGGSNGAPGQRKQRKRAIIDLALEAYREQEASSGRTKDVQSVGIDEEFKQAAITQIRTFIFAGHDTTSSTICYALYMLQKNPETLARIRREHDEVLGSVEETPDAIKSDPHILNKLEYTLCVIRETLRLWPAASSTRRGPPGFIIRDPKTGEAFDVGGDFVWIVHFAQQRDPKVWGESADRFDPSRFLAANAATLPENGWRPFEKGPRNCIGQELALLEARVILALVVRSFDFRTAYDALDDLAGDGSYYARDARYRTGKQDLDGEEAYPILVGSAKPREGMPVRVSRVLQ